MFFQLARQIHERASDQLLGSVPGTGIDDGPAVNERTHRPQTALDHRRLVLDDHVQANAHGVRFGLLLLSRRSIDSHATLTILLLPQLPSAWAGLHVQGGKSVRGTPRSYAKTRSDRSSARQKKAAAPREEGGRAVLPSCRTRNCCPYPCPAARMPIATAMNIDQVIRTSQDRVAHFLPVCSIKRR
jgi:hypothetical protein